MSVVEVAHGPGELGSDLVDEGLLANLSTESVHQTAHGATHQALIEDQRYAAQSARAIEAVVQAVRTGAPLSP